MESDRTDCRPVRPAPAAPLRTGLRAGLVAVAALLLAAAAPGFVDGLPDVPLMPGLTGSEAPAMVFDTPGGRIVEVRTAGAVDAAAVRTFYAETLPQLGWQAAGPDRFRRADEVLEMQIGDPGGALVVQFFLRPD